MKREEKPRLSQASNNRKVNYKYYSIKGDDTKKFAVLAGRCKACNKITDSFCDNCQEFVCEKHSSLVDNEDYECYCLKCKEELHL